MNILYYIINKFFKDEKFKTIIIIILSLTLNFLKINVISFISANIIESIKNNKMNITYKFFYYFIIVSIFYIILYTIYKLFQNKLLTKLRQWTRVELLSIILNSNNENYSDINFTKLNSLLLRISNTIFYVFNNIFTTIFPNITLIFIVFFYLFYKNYIIGLIFLTGNLLIMIYLYFTYKYIHYHNKKYEEHIMISESYLVEILNNIDKIIFRGNSDNELNVFDNKSSKTTELGFKFYSSANYHGLIMNIIIFITSFISIFYLIKLYYNKEITSTIFITFITILILHRDIISSTIQQLPDFIEFLGRSENMINILNDMNDNYLNDSNKEYDNNNIPFDTVKFENVTFKYKNGPIILNNFNLEIKLDGIIGITGLSGNGKSTLAKLLVKIYKLNDGNVYIDGVNIKNINPKYLRKNIILNNQNSKLFDTKIIENIFYTCNDKNKCIKYLNEIMQYKKIKELLDSIDIYNKNAGTAGENMSGGQRQIINIINSLIVDSKVVILDEPTNALDKDLKNDVISLIQYFKKYKKCIIVITHDKDLYPIFTKKIEI
jgi:ABC-type bacteriocin/lantibiotic exporter with double-glycine peptidase domain